MIEPTQLVVERIHHYRDTIRNYHVEVDGERVGRVKDNDHVAFEVTPGQHTVRFKLMWISSPPLSVDIGPGEALWVRCGPNGGLLQAWRLFVSVRTAIFAEVVPPPDEHNDALS